MSSVSESSAPTFDTMAGTPFLTSASVDQLLPALFAAQGAIGPALKGSQNPHFKSRYADLSDVMDACFESLRENGFAISYPMAPLSGGGAEIILVLWHVSGQWIRSSLTLAPGDPQKVGSAITYYRRYLLAALLAISTTDDDGEAAQGRGQGAEQPRRESRPQQSNSQRKQESAPRNSQDAPSSTPDRRQVNSEFPTAQDLAAAVRDIRAWASEFVPMANNWWTKTLRKANRTVPSKYEKVLEHENHLLNHLAKDAHARGGIVLPEGFKFTSAAVCEALAPLWITHADAIEKEAWRYVQKERPQKIGEEMKSPAHAN